MKKGLERGGEQGGVLAVDEVAGVDGLALSEQVTAGDDTR